MTTCTRCGTAIELFSNGAPLCLLCDERRGPVKRTNPCDVWYALMNRYADASDDLNEALARGHGVNGEQYAGVFKEAARLKNHYERARHNLAEHERAHGCLRSVEARIS